MNILDLKKESLTVGRAATGIYLILRENMCGADVILPANICYAAVYPVVYSSNNPVFCDVDGTSGNMSYKSFIQALTPETRAAIVPHMYGNPVKDMPEIARYCKENDILLIEDCASAMGAELGGQQTGSFGDYTVFSTGYSKTVDLGNGGIILSDRSLCAMRKAYGELPLYTDETEKRNGDFSKAYRAFRNSRLDIRESAFYQTVHSDLRDNFLYRTSDEFSDTVIRSLSGLDKIISERRRASSLYDSYLRYDGSNLSAYPFADGAVPWRKNIFVRPEKRNEIVKRLLDKKIPVSDWYPSINIFFDDYTVYPQTAAMEQTILNFPLLISDDEIRNIADAVNYAVFWRQI